LDGFGWQGHETLQFEGIFLEGFLIVFAFVEFVGDSKLFLPIKQNFILLFLPVVSLKLFFPLYLLLQ